MQIKYLFGSKIVAISYLVLVSTSVLGDILYWTVSKGFAAYAKLFFYPVILISLIELIISKRIIRDRFITTNLILMSVAFLIGFYNNPISKEFFAHFSPFILATIVFSYGYKSVAYGESILKYIDKHIIKAGLILCIFVLIYFISYKFGYVEYFGAGALFAYPIFYCITNGYYKIAGGFWLINILTGKRSVLLAITLVLMIYAIKRLKPKWSILIFSILTLVILNYVNSGLELSDDISGTFERYVSFLRYIAENDDLLKALDLATSGRLYDGIAVIDKLGSNWLNWLWGMGFGSTFSVDYSFSDESHVTHYSHITPLSYILLGGVILFLAVYLKILQCIKYALNNLNDPVSMMVIYFFIIGFGGAIYFTDPFVWIFMGIFSAKYLNNVQKSTLFRRHNLSTIKLG